jgi:RimJ/RimL family protein N-acetyltransferase
VDAQPQLTTERLLLRRWRAADLDPFADVNADPAVMEYYPATLSRARTEALIERIDGYFEDHGYGLWSVELPREAPFVGYVGLTPVDKDVPFAPAVELGWRLARDFWGRGIATEGARAASAFAFEQLRLPELVAYTAVGNLRSRRVMERLGMRRDPAEDFIHPGVPPSHALAAHVLYRMPAPRTP